MKLEFSKSCKYQTRWSAEGRLCLPPYSCPPSLLTPSSLPCKVCGHPRPRVQTLVSYFPYPPLYEHLPLNQSSVLNSGQGRSVLERMDPAKILTQALETGQVVIWAESSRMPRASAWSRISTSECVWIAMCRLQVDTSPWLLSLPVLRGEA